MTAILDIHARQILDSRGNPTVEVDVFLEDGSMKFSVNPQAAERARLHVSSLLLKLAVIVKE